MSFDYRIPVFNKDFAKDTSNYSSYIDDQTIGQAVVLNSDLKSNIVNSMLYKLSASINYDQQFGASMWLPEKQYTIGAIVCCLIKVNQVPKLVYVKCIANDSRQNYCTQEPFQNCVKDNSGAVYFNSDIINSQWEMVTLGSNEKKRITFQTEAGCGNSDSKMKNVTLIDFTSYRDFVECVFILKIKRDNESLVAKIHTHALGNRNIEVFVQDVLCSKYNFDSTNSIFNRTSKFKDTALLGCILSVDSNGKLCLNVLNKDSLSSVEVTTEYIDGNITPNPNQVNKGITWFNQNNNIVVPFRSGASSCYNNCGMIIPFFETLSYERVFRNGLYKLGSAATLDQFVYPGIQLNGGSNQIYDIDKRYLVQDNTSRLIEPELPNIKSSNITGAARFSLREDPYNQNDWYPFITESTSQQSYVTSGRGISLKGFDASKKSSIYKDGATVKPKSTQVQYYIKLF